MNFFRVWDTPGLGDGVAIDQIHKKKMTELLYKTYSVDGITYGFIDMVIVIVEGSNRDMGTTYTLLNEVVVPNIQKERIFVIINQADVAMKGRHWNHSTRTPDSQLITFLEEQAMSIQKRVREATGINIMKPVYYSAEYGWNVQAVFDFIIDHMPPQRRPLIKIGGYCMRNSILESISSEIEADNNQVISDRDILLKNIEQLKQQKLNILFVWSNWCWEKFNDQCDF